jgi:hypothetical protein
MLHFEIRLSILELRLSLSLYHSFLFYLFLGCYSVISPLAEKSHSTDELGAKLLLPLEMNKVSLFHVFFLYS